MIYRSFQVVSHLDINHTETSVWLLGKGASWPGKDQLSNHPQFYCVPSTIFHPHCISSSSVTSRPVYIQCRPRQDSPQCMEETGVTHHKVRTSTGTLISPGHHSGLMKSHTLDSANFSLNRKKKKKQASIYTLKFQRKYIPNAGSVWVCRAWTNSFSYCKCTMLIKLHIISPAQWQQHCLLLHTNPLHHRIN